MRHTASCAGNPLGATWKLLWSTAWQGTDEETRRMGDADSIEDSLKSRLEVVSNAPIEKLDPACEPTSEPSPKSLNRAHPNSGMK
jgi:hypothetical protein